MSSTIKVKPEQLAAAIRKELESYSKAATEETKELIRETAKICKEEIQSASPVRTGKYRKGWSIKPLWEDNDSLREIVRNRVAASPPLGKRSRKEKRRARAGVPAHQTRRRKSD